MTIKLDTSDCSVVVLCSDCPHWQAFAWTEDEANRRAISHESDIHDGRVTYRRRLEKRAERARHAASAAFVAAHPDSSRRGITRQTRTRQAH